MPILSHVLKRHKHAVISLFLACLALLLTVVRLDSAPPLWWDEGWTLNVARNWVEHGHYGQFLNGERRSPGLAGHFPVVASAALSFRLFGVGIWQGRLPFVLFTLAALALMVYIARRLYNRPVAIATLAVLLLIAPNRWLHPILMGRQALGEIPSLAFLLAGYVCLLIGWNRPWIYLPITCLAWGAALITKAQVLPFWTISLLAPILVAVFRRNRRVVFLLAIAWLASFVISRALVELQGIALSGNTVPGAMIPGLLSVTALVLTPITRAVTLVYIVALALPTAFSLGYAAWQLLHRRAEIDIDHPEEIVRLALLTFAGSWLAWYAFLSIGWLRYLLPVTFVGSMFLATMLYDLTDGFSIRSTILRAGLSVRHLRFNRYGTGALFAIFSMLILGLLTLGVLNRAYVTEANDSVRQVADYLNTRTEPDALVETYESELFVLLDRPYHFPPDSMNVLVIARSFLGQDVEYGYDPLVFDPNYLVLGPFGRQHQVYDTVVAIDAFELVAEFGEYAIYERNR